MRLSIIGESLLVLPAMSISKKRIDEFQQFIFSWWKTNRRDLPWRRTSDPYKILISEVMLQQTQVLRVIPKYAEFIEVYPTVDHLAKASPGDVLRIWKGMGYNRRALYLQKTAQEVAGIYHGIFPKDEQSLTKLPGLGTYTARAIMVFAYRQNVAMVDTNVRQIITHFFFKDKPQKPLIIQAVADQLVPKDKSWEWHQALMDYGSIHNSEFMIQNTKLPKIKIPFKESNRFYRGRIIDILRSDKSDEYKLVTDLMKKYGKPRQHFQLIIENLVKDGLVVKKNTLLHLPE